MTSPDETFSVEIDNSNGTVSATGTAVVAAGGSAVLLSGLLADVNAALATVQITDVSLGAGQVAIKASDSDGGHAGPLKIATTTTRVTVLAQRMAAFGGREALAALAATHTPQAPALAIAPPGHGAPA